MNLGVNGRPEALNAEHRGDVQESSLETLDDDFGMDDADEVDEAEESSKVRHKANEKKRGYYKKAAFETTYFGSLI